jgi:hypothetical protein
VRDRRLAEIEDAGEVDVDDPPPALVVDFHEPGRLGDARVVDQDVDLAERFDDLGNGGGATGAIGDVDDDAEMPLPERCRDLGRCRVTIKGGHPGTVPGEQPRCREPDPPRACGT